MNIIFMGTPDFALESLKAIYNAGHNIMAVVTNPDRPKGRGMKMIASPVKEFAKEKAIKVFQPEKVRNNQDLVEEIAKFNPDVICVVAYGKILPKEILEIPKYGCINVHGSLLPKYRGAAPVQWSVLNGDNITGITTMYMDEGMDTGDIILQETVKIGKDETTGELWERLSVIGGRILVKTLEQIEKKNAPRHKQEGEFTLAPMLNKEMAKINWQKNSAEEIKNLVRGLNPIIGAYSYINNKKFKIWKIQIISNEEFVNKYKEFQGYENKLYSIEPGTIIYIDKKQGVYIKAKDKVVLLLEVQAENSKKMSIQDFLRGNKIEVGNILE